ncbi:MAG TPA: hypothetical protein VNZ64_05645 [Candidatus Acidoferrum sp.]|jgi:hypothetical protein|nr:hypothetical protein [Candidatus Acidoferrum sp.]
MSSSLPTAPNAVNVESYGLTPFLTSASTKPRSLLAGARFLKSPGRERTGPDAERELVEGDGASEPLN